jgi:gluconokinase
VKVFIGVDIGTTHTKAVACNEDTAVLSEYKETNATYHSVEDAAEQDAEEIFQNVLSVINKTTAQLNGSHEIVSVSFSAAMHSIIAVDENGTPLTPLMIWADKRSKKIADNLRASDTGKLLWLQTGTPVHAMTPLCKIKWIKENQPEFFNRAYKFIGIKEYIFFKLFNKYVIDYSIASATGLLNVQTLNWHEPSLQFAGIDKAKLSNLVSVFHSERAIDKRFADRIGLKKDIPFVTGASDGCLANLGSGVLLRGEAALTIGTSGAIRRTIENPLVDKEQRLFTYYLADNLFVQGGATNNGGNVLQYWVQNHFPSAGDFNKIIEAAFTVSAGCNGLVCLPYFFGERAPVWDADAKAVFSGESDNHGDLHFVRAVMEGICFTFRQLLHALEENKKTIDCIYASGGFIQSKQWVQLMADILQKKIIISNTADASAIGAVFLAMKALNFIQNLQEVKKYIKEGEVFVPSSAYREVYKRNFEIFKHLYKK